MNLVEEMVEHLTNPNREEGEQNMALLIVQERPSRELIDQALAIAAKQSNGNAETRKRGIKP